jgi:hypothetical protein
MENSGAEETTNAQTLLLGKSIGYVRCRCRGRHLELWKLTSDELVTLAKAPDLWLFITNTF